MNLYRFMSCSPAVSVFVVLAVVQLVSATGVQAQVRHTIIAASGEAAPAGGTYGNFLNTISLNARGEVAFDVRLGGPSTSGVFVSNGATTQAIAAVPAQTAANQITWTTPRGSQLVGQNTNAANGG